MIEATRNARSELSAQSKKEAEFTTSLRDSEHVTIPQPAVLRPDEEVVVTGVQGKFQPSLEDTMRRKTEIGNEARGLQSVFSDSKKGVISELGLAQEWIKLAEELVSITRDQTFSGSPEKYFGDKIEAISKKAEGLLQQK